MKRDEIFVSDVVTINGCPHYKADDKELSNIRYLAGLWRGHSCLDKKMAELRRENARLRAACTKAQDTFADMALAMETLGKDGFARAMRIAEEATRDALRADR